jgi:hypothetical protein
VENWIPIYQNKYLLMGNTQIMLIKISWDWAVYWAIPCLLFTNKAFTDLKILKDLFAGNNSLGRKFGMLNKIMQDLFLAWQPYETEIFSDSYVDAFDARILKEFQKGMEVRHDSKQLIEQIAKNMEILEQTAATIFRFVSHQAKGTPLDMKVDPYSISLEPDADMSKHANGLSPDDEITKDIQQLWLYGKKEMAV